MKIEEYLNKICLFVGLNPEEAEVNIQEVKDRLEINLQVPQDIASYFIGRKGETLYALQYLIRITFGDEYPDVNLVLDINGYQQEREDKLVEKALKTAYRVLETGEATEFRHLNSYERYLVHSAIAQDPELEELTTESKTVYGERWLTIDFQEIEEEIDVESEESLEKEEDFEEVGDAEDVEEGGEDQTDEVLEPEE